eukprot:TRINITY_DN26210_c0_g1_i1.p1 TRINITY_DN26210_c0_g1~~TRINITY_DN26210_c0_g1_i1.p1  ORF type:complete len:675 (-),score=161.19 TRINITY_DN26210_c0_g1_i1:8-1849(-)
MTAKVQVQVHPTADKAAWSLSACCARICSSFLGAQSSRHASRVETLRQRLLAEGRQGTLDIQTLRLHVNPGRPFKEHYDTNLFESLGSGGFGEVYRTIHKGSGNPRAVKVLRRDALHPRLDTVCAELESLLELDHPHVLRLYDFFEDSLAVYLVTELAVGGDLNDVIQDVGTPGHDEVSRRLFRQLLLAVAYCHARGVCHRDLKVENCLLSTKEERLLKVIDFGLAAIKSPSDEDGHWLRTTLGTPFYMSPEVIDKRATYGTKCDVWSAGIILYQLLTGEHPFSERHGTQLGGVHRLFDRICHAQPHEGPLEDQDVPELARDLLRAMLQKDPDKRPSAQEVLQHAWLTSTPCPSPSVAGGSSASASGTASERCSRGRAHLRRFRSIVGFSRLERAILTLAAHQARDEDLTELRRAFSALDVDGNGLLSKKQIEEAFDCAGVPFEAGDLEAVFDAFDRKGLGKIEYTSWLAATLHPDLLASEQAVRGAFAYFAGSCDSPSISKDELLKMLDEDDAHAALSRWGGGGGSGSGTLDEAEFRALVADLAARRRLFEISPTAASATPGSSSMPRTPLMLQTPRSAPSPLAASGAGPHLLFRASSPSATLAATFAEDLD